jgi:FKBP-type peptidyl-prolyl cis-trans isomerase
MKDRRFFKRKRRATGSPLFFERVEPRQLMAGDIGVFVRDNLLIVTGDAAANQIEITGNLQGGFSVAGQDSTTINGRSTPFVSGRVLGLSVNLGLGNDKASILGAITQGILIEAGEGNNDVRVRHSHVTNFRFVGGTGNDTLELDNFYTRFSSQIELGEGNDNLAVVSHSSGAWLFVDSGAGNDLLVFNHVGMRGQLRLETGAGDDQVMFAGQSWLGRSSSIRTGGGDDFVGFLGGRTGASVHYGKNFFLATGSGDDQAVLDDNTTGQRGNFDGGLSQDSFQRSSLLDRLITSISWEGRSVSGLSGRLDTIHNRMIENSVDPLPFGGPSIPVRLGLTTTSGQAVFTEGGIEVAVDPGLVLAGPPGAALTTATLAIDQFDPQNDLLLFTNVGGISGNFNNSNGVMTLTGTGTLAEWQSALRSVRFRNSDDTPPAAARRVTIEVRTAGDSATAFRDLRIAGVADAPVLTIGDTEHDLDIDATTSPFPFTVAGDLQLSDVDTTEFNPSNVSVTIVTGGRSGDVLAAATTSGVSASYDAATRRLTFSGPSMTTATLQTLLRSVTFNNTNSRAPTGTRRISFSVSDGDLTVTREVVANVIATMSPALVTSTSVQTFTETDDPVQVDNGLTITPPAVSGGSFAISSATVSITGGYASTQDRLLFPASPGFTGNFDPATGILTINGSGNTDAWRNLLRSVRFENEALGNNLTIGDRIIEFRIVSNSGTASDTRTLRVSRASDERLIQNYLQANGQSGAAQRTSTGLYYIVEVQGNGQFPNANSTVTVNYEGFLLNGSRFDGNDNSQFSLQQVIAGWTEGIPKFSRGGRGQLLIPSNLAYGSQARPGIPANSVLRFEVELLDFS